MRDQPTAAALATAIAQMLRSEVVPRLDGRPAFQVRVAANALDIIARELALGPAADEEERRRLAALLGEDGDPAALNQLLCRRIGAGELTLASPGVADHLWQTTLDKLAIDQPAYATYRRVLAERTAAGAEARGSGEVKEGPKDGL